MVLSWFMDDNTGDQKLPHQLHPDAFIDVDDLKKLCGVLHWKIDADHYEEEGLLDHIKKARGYNYTDFVEVCRDKLPNYDMKVKQFFEEHLHSDEEIRLVLSGSGYFDIRSKDDRWIRISVEKGDMIVLPAGSYHRFTVDTNDYIKAMRLFCGEPIWTPINRPLGDDHPSRQLYLTSFNAPALEAEGIAA